MTTAEQSPRRRKDNLKTKVDHAAFMALMFLTFIGSEVIYNKARHGMAEVRYKFRKLSAKPDTPSNNTSPDHPAET